MTKELWLSLRKQAARVLKYHPSQKINKNFGKTKFNVDIEAATQVKFKILLLEIIEVWLFLAC